MNSNYLCDVGYVSLTHDGEQLCGDNVQIIRIDESTCIMVLADGLGSGVKANILSILTSKMIATMMANNISLKECVKTIMETLPVCKERHVAYSTFTIVRVKENRKVDIYNYENPEPFLIRNGKAKMFPMEEIDIAGKKIQHSKFIALENDCIFAMSDGMLYASEKNELNYDWDIPQILDYVESYYDENSSAKANATILIDYVNNLYSQKPSDDVTCSVIKIRKRNHINILIGPSENKADDNKMLSLFFSKEGKHIVCGGSTSKMVASYLNEKIINIITDNDDSTIPPICKIKGVDLVTEGIITLNKVLEYAKNFNKNNEEYFTWFYQEDGASQIMRLLFEEASDIDFFVGCAVNPAYQRNDDAFSFKNKMLVIQEIVSILKENGKKVKVNYF